MDNIPEFSLSLNLLEEIHRLYPSFILPLNLHKEQGESDFLEDDYEDYPLEEPSTYGRYAGSWAQRVERYSDDDIDTIFDGDPDAYWNID